MAQLRLEDYGCGWFGLFTLGAIWWGMPSDNTIRKDMAERQQRQQQLNKNIGKLVQIQTAVLEELRSSENKKAEVQKK